MRYTEELYRKAFPVEEPQAEAKPVEKAVEKISKDTAAVEKPEEEQVDQSEEEANDGVAGADKSDT